MATNGTHNQDSAAKSNADEEAQVLSYQHLRRAVGVLGFSLPFLLVIGAFVVASTLRPNSSKALQSTISDYYYTPMRGVFVGVLFAIGVFLFSYKGHKPTDNKVYQPSDNIAGYLACVFALGVALFPTSPEGSDGGAVATVHTVSAAAFFLTLAYFSLYLFTKTKTDGTPPSPEKEFRNKIYVACGVIILVCIALIAIKNSPLFGSSFTAIKPVFWLESLALWAFGVAWFVKGETLWKDKDGDAVEGRRTPSVDPLDR